MDGMTVLRILRCNRQGAAPPSRGDSRYIPFAFPAQMLEHAAYPRNLSLLTVDLTELL